MVIVITYGILFELLNKKKHSIEELKNWMFLGLFQAGVGSTGHLFYLALSNYQRLHTQGSGIDRFPNSALSSMLSCNPYIHFLRKDPPVLFPFFNSTVCFYWWVLRVHFILYILVLCQICDLQIFSLGLYFFFHPLQSVIHKTKAFSILMKCNSSTWDFMDCAFGVESKNSLLLCFNVDPEILSGIFSKSVSLWYNFS